MGVAARFVLRWGPSLVGLGVTVGASGYWWWVLRRTPPCWGIFFYDPPPPQYTELMARIHAYQHVDRYLTLAAVSLAVAVVVPAVRAGMRTARRAGAASSGRRQVFVGAGLAGAALIAGVLHFAVVAPWMVAWQQARPPVPHRCANLTPTNDELRAMPPSPVVWGVGSTGYVSRRVAPAVAVGGLAYLLGLSAGLRRARGGEPPVVAPDPGGLGPEFDPGGPAASSGV